MKKIFTILSILALTTSMSYAATSLGDAIKADFHNTASSFKNAVRTDINNAKAANTSAAQARKEEKLKQIDTKLAQLNNEYQTVKNQQYGITESERNLRMNMLQRQIDFYNKQKAALK